jgi:pyridoxine 5-phosphate synthase
MAISLSVNVNKIATLRNSRGGDDPNVLRAVDTCLAAGAPGITVHPRADARHIRPADVTDIAALLHDRVTTAGRRPEFNIEGDPRPDLVAMVLSVKPDQCTLVPVVAGEITSQAGWSPATEPRDLRDVIRRMQDAGVRVSLFVDPAVEAVDWAAGRGADRIELYTEPYAAAFAQGEEAVTDRLAAYVVAAEAAHRAGLGVNAGHDLNLENLVRFRTLPHLDEVSIGHALVSRALWVGLDRVVREYLAVLSYESRPSARGAV